MKAEVFSRLPNIGSKVLLVGSSHTGNNIFATPAIHLLKKYYPNTLFDVVGSDKLSADVFSNNSDINQIFIKSKHPNLKSFCGNYSYVMCLSYKSKNMISDINTDMICEPEWLGENHHAEHLLQFIASFIGHAVTDADRAYFITPNPFPDYLLKKIDFKTNDTLICLHVGCGRTSTQGWKFWYKGRTRDPRLWPLDRYIEFATDLIRENPRIRFVITGTKNEMFLGNTFKRHVPRTINLIGKTTIGTLFALMQYMDLFISQDCGIFHVACASTVSLIGLFGPTTPAQTGPYPRKKNHTLIVKEKMLDITVTDVINAAQKCLHLFSKARRLVE